MANEFVIKNGFHSKGDSQVTGSLSISSGITGSLLGSASYALTASYVNLAISASYISPTFVSASAAASGFGAGGGSGTGFPFSGSAIITGSLLISGSGLRVTGSLGVSGSINGTFISLGGGNVSTNIAIGSASLESNTTGISNVAIGNLALKSPRVERFHTAIGAGAMEFASSSVAENDWGNASIGYQAGRFMTGSRNAAIGFQAMYQSAGSTGARLSVAIGYQALYGNGGGVNGDFNMAIGYRSMFNAGTVGQNLAFGYQSLEQLKVGSGNSIIGNRAGQFISQSNDVVAIGRVALQNAKRVQQVVAIGESAMLNQYPTDTGTMITAASVAVGYKALQGVVGNANTGVRNVAIGDNSSQFSSTGNDNTVVGYAALTRNVIGSNNVAIGSSALFYASGSDNTSIGYYSGRLLSGSGNVAIGYYALEGATAGALLNDMNNNTAIGYGAGRYISSSRGNVFIGYNAGPAISGGGAKTVVNNQLYIANTAGNPLIGGNFTARTVTISGSLYISGSIIPNADATLTSSFELGSPTAAWNRIWVRSSSIHFVDDSGNELAKISATPAGAIELPNIYTSGTFTAQTFVTQSTTTIIEIFHATGSNKFGSSSLDTHQFTGSVLVSGSLNQTAGSTTTRNATINGNLVTTGSVQFTGLQESSQNYLVSIDATTGQLYYTASSAFTPNAIDPSAFATTGSNNFYGNQTIYDSDSIVSIETSTGIRRLYDFNTNTSIDWADRVLYDNLNIPSINYNSRELRDESSTTLLEYSNNQVRLTQDVLMTGLSQDIADSVITIDTTTGQLYTTSSTAFVANIGDVATYLGPLNNFSASILAFTSSIQNQVNNLNAATSSYVLNSATSSMSVLSSSYALTASYALNVPTVDTSALVGTASFNAFTSSIQNQVNNLAVATSSYVVNSITSSMLAPYTLLSVTSSMTVLSASYASTASYYNGSVISASYAVTASYISPNFISASVAASGFSSATDISALNTFTGSIQTQVDNLTSATSSYVTNSVTASMLNPYVLTASTSSMSVLSSSFAATASFVRTAQTASFSTTLGASLSNSGTTLSLRHSSGGILNTIDRLTAAEALTSSIALTVSQSQAGSGSLGNGFHRVALLDPGVAGGYDTSPIYVDHQGITYNALTNTLTVGGTISANSITASLEGTGSWAIQAQTASYYGGSVTSASFALTSSVSTLATTASYVLQAVSASFYGGSVTSASFASTASFYGGSVASASFANTASFVNRLNQNVTVTGSVNVSASVTAQSVSASFTGSLTGHVTSSAIDTAQYKLKVNNVQKVDWDLGILGLAETQSIDWTNRYLLEGGDVSVDWGNRALNDSNGAIPSINWENRSLYDIAGNEIATYDNRNKFTVIGNVTTTLNGNSWAEALNDTHSFYAGEIHNNYTLDANYDAGYLLYLDYTLNKWTVVDQTTNSCINFLGVNTQGKGADPTVLTDGFLIMTDAANPQAGIDVYITNPLLGRPVYIIESADGSPGNSFSCTIPSSGYVRVVGHVVARGSNVTDNYMIKFRPSNDWYEI